MKRLFVAVAVQLLCVVPAFASKAPPSFRFDSDQAVAVDGYLDDLVLRTSSKDPKVIREELEQQLFFLVGSLNQYFSAADLGHAEVKILSSAPVAGADYSEVHYSVKLLVGWDKKQPVPVSIPIVLPLRLDDSGQAFYQAYSATCAEDGSASELDTNSFYYFYRPEKEGCQLLKDALDPALARATAMHFKPSNQNTAGKFPEYGKVWEDGQLVATLIFGTFAKGATSNRDAGIAAYNAMYTQLRNRFGRPMMQNVPIRKIPGYANPDVEMSWELDGNRKLNVNILLLDKMALSEGTPDKFAARYNERTRASDFVSYNGHSGFGENIRALAKMGSFVPGQYQLYMVNGCDTFFYVDDSLRAAHATVNPGSLPYQYFDIITNSLPSYFDREAQHNMAILDALIGKQRTYREILSQFDPRQHAIVTGEEDNQWPAVFKP